MAAAEKDEVVRRVVVEYGHHYAYAYLADSNGRVLQEEAFKQPFRLERKDVHEEATDCWQQIYQWLQDTVLWYSTARDDDPAAESNEDESSEE